jgi:hypothetical protein
MYFVFVFEILSWHVFSYLVFKYFKNVFYPTLEERLFNTGRQVSKPAGAINSLMHIVKWTVAASQQTLCLKQFL